MCAACREFLSEPEKAGPEAVQSFDPIPLYEVMEGPGLEPNTEQKGEAEYHASFCRTDVKQEEKGHPHASGGADRHAADR